MTDKDSKTTEDEPTQESGPPPKSEHPDPNLVIHEDPDQKPTSSISEG